ncbi:DUF885 domain-containing protein [Oleiharenicola sp. Vm1]|uniref:DUF885 domain-containing protein n=1 Tax=Oleiharenicola sp. Vm1 TaxID=3398393 RepID=UPI0039F57753
MKLPRLFAVAALSASTLLAANADFDRWAESFSADWVRANPTFSTIQQYLPAAEQDALDRQLTPNTRDYRAGRVAAAKAALAELAKFDRATLSADQRTSAATIEWSLRGIVESEPFADYNFVFNQFGGLHVNTVNFLTQSHPIRNRRDIENYLARLQLVAGRIDEGIAQAKDAAARGFLMPDFITKSVLGQFERFLAGPPHENRFVAALAERAAPLKDVTAEERAQFVATAEKITTEQILPAFRRAQAMLQEQLPHTTSAAGLCRLPGGDKAYANALKRFTTTDLTAEQIHQLGLREVARIEKEMDGYLRQLGYADGSIKERMERLEHDLQPKEADPRPRLLAKFDSILRDAEQRAKLVFDLTPKAPVVVKREPPFTEKTAAAHYTGPAKDGSRPGIFWAPLPGPTFEIATMRTLVYHEGVPGHHFQIALQRETEGLPRYRRDGVFGGGSAYAEGWALYAEQLAAENGWYDGDLVGHLGQLDDELFRARRLVVDTGLHAFHWTRQQAIDYGIKASEVERYVMNPGQACAYKIGMLKILELRAKAQRALGPKFEIKKFHNLVLQTGNVPLAVLEQVVDGWIAAQP